MLSIEQEAGLGLVITIYDIDLLFTAKTTKRSNLDLDSPSILEIHDCQTAAPLL